jgi:hypothetical protein
LPAFAARDILSAMRLLLCLALVGCYPSPGGGAPWFFINEPPKQTPREECDRLASPAMQSNMEFGQPLPSDCKRFAKK